MINHLWNFKIHLISRFGYKTREPSFKVQNGTKQTYHHSQHYAAWAVQNVLYIATNTNQPINIRVIINLLSFIYHSIVQHAVWKRFYRQMIVHTNPPSAGSGKANVVAGNSLCSMLCGKGHIQRISTTKSGLQLRWKNYWSVRKDFQHQPAL